MKFTVECFDLFGKYWRKSANSGLRGEIFNTLEAAKKASDDFRSGGMAYRVVDSLGNVHDGVNKDGEFFKVEKHDAIGRWDKSNNSGLHGVRFLSVSDATSAIKECGSSTVTYRVVNDAGEVCTGSIDAPSVPPTPSLPPLVLQKEPLETVVKRVIYSLAGKMPYLTADDVQAVLAMMGWTSAEIGNRAGSFFRGNEDVTKTEGYTVRSKRAGRNSSQISVYRSNIFEGKMPLVYNFVREYNEKSTGATA